MRTSLFHIAHIVLLGDGSRSNPESDNFRREEFKANKQQYTQHSYGNNFGFRIDSRANADFCHITAIRIQHPAFHPER
jgi:hypothetical protein